MRPATLYGSHKMAKRAAGKATGKPAKKTAGTAAAKETLRALESKTGALAGDLTRLKRQLRTAKARIEELEGRQEDALNRIDWAIDSLHNLLDDQN